MAGGAVGGAVAAGAEVVAGGAVAAGSVVAGAVVRGAAVDVANEMVGDADADTDADGDDELVVDGDTALRPRKSTKKSSRVSRLPATAASARSIQRGPRRGGGMILVVSPDTPSDVARAVPPLGRSADCSLARSMRSNSGMKWFVPVALLAACTAPAVVTSPSPTPTVTLATSTAPKETASPTQTVAASPTAGDPSRYGYILASQGRIVVRRERETDASIVIGGDAPVASHDGTRVAYWLTATSPQELRILAVASGAERAVTTIAAGQGGGAIAWADDDTGLLYETHSTAATPPGPPTAPPSQLFSYDLSASQNAVATDAALKNAGGLVFIPLAWDKSEGIAAALTTGEGGFAADYIVWDKRPSATTAVKRTIFPWRVTYGSVQANSNATTVLANDFDLNGLRFWPLADIGNAQHLTPLPGTKSLGASWRPWPLQAQTFGGEFVWVTGFSAALYTFATDRVPTQLHRGQSDVAIAGWRADGSGVLLTENGLGVFVVDLATGKETPLPHLGRPLAGGVLLR